MTTPLLGALVLLTAVNPPRLHGRLLLRRPLPAAVTATVTVTVTVVLLAALAAPLADVLELAVPSVRLSAGIVAVAAGVGHVVSPAPVVQDPPRSPVAAGAVPLAFPLLLRPEVVLTALSVGLDHGVAVAGIGALVATAAGSVAALAPPGRDALWGAGGRLVGGVLVLLGVGLGVSGALSV